MPTPRVTVTVAATLGLGIRPGTTHRIIPGTTPIGTGMIPGTMVGTIPGTMAGTILGITVITDPGIIPIGMATILIMVAALPITVGLQERSIMDASAIAVPGASVTVTQPPIRLAPSAVAA